MQIEPSQLLSQGLDRKTILTKLRSAGHQISQSSLNSIWDICQAADTYAQMDTLEQVIYKLNELSILQNKRADDLIVKECLISLAYRGGKMNYLEIIAEKFKASMVVISPYEYCLDKFFVAKPPAELFKFRPESNIQMSLKRFQMIRDNARETLQQGSFIGVLYEKPQYTNKQAIFCLQNQSNHTNINLSNANINTYLIPGCTYIAKGSTSRDLVMNVTELQLPPPVKRKDDFARRRFDEACQIISELHNDPEELGQHHGTEFSKESLARLNITLFDEKELQSPVLIVGNVTLTPETIFKIQSIIERFGTVRCVILMLSNDQHQILNLDCLKVQVFIVPHLQAPGPQTIPKIPLTKQAFKNCEILTNPAKICICGQNIALMNYALINKLNNKNLSQRAQISKSQDLVKLIGSFVFSQANLGISMECYWEQSSYMDVYGDTVVFSTDIQCPQGKYQVDRTGAFVSVGHFNRDSEFIIYYPNAKNGILLSAL